MVERGRRDGKEDEEDEEARRRTRQEEEEKEAEEEEQATDIKSNNPHLAGGEKTWVCFTNDRCSQCAHFSARIGHAHSANEKAALEYAQKIHLSNVKAYRTLQCRLATLSEQSTVPGATESCLMIAIDGLDQAKTRYPRNLRSSKTLDKCWRPQVHLIGYICYGATYLNE